MRRAVPPNRPIANSARALRHTSTHVLGSGTPAPPTELPLPEPDVAPKRDFDAAKPRELDEVAVVHAGQCQQVGAFRVESLGNAAVAHVLDPSTRI